jgi:hypothetical protein
MMQYLCLIQMQANQMNFQFFNWKNRSIFPDALYGQCILVQSTCIFLTAFWLKGMAVIFI